MSDLKNAKKTPTNGKPLRRRLCVLTKRSDFLKTFRLGSKIRPCDWMIFNFVASEKFRCGWTCPKAVGVAPIRNRMKRWTREWLSSQLKSETNMPLVDLNIGFRPMPAEFYKSLKRADFDQAMQRGWNQLVKRTTKDPTKTIIPARL